MEVSNEVKAAQEAYAARPFAVRWVDSHFSGTSRMHTFEEAFAYAQSQWARVQKQVSIYPYRASELRRSYIETPEGKISLRFYFLSDDVSSY